MNWNNPVAVAKYQADWRATKRKRAIDKLGGQCARCGFADIRALQIDHVNGGGSQHRRHHHTRKILDQVLNGTGGPFQCLCANCNWIKRAEEREYGNGNSE